MDFISLTLLKMLQKNRSAIGIAIFALIDIVETWYILGNGIGVEINPIYGYVGLGGITAIKILCVGLMIFAWHKEKTGKLIGYTAMIMAIPAIWNLFVIFG